MRRRNVLFPAAALLLLPLLTGCPAEPPPEEPEPDPEVAPAPEVDLPREATGAPLREGEEVGSAVADALVRGLVGELERALEEEGPVGAADFCSVEAIPITERIQDEVRRETGREVAVKRTTDRVRNPDNAPDALEEQVLEYYRQLIAAEEPPPDAFVQQVDEEEVRYYRPLRTGGMCLNCHGDPDAMEPEVVRILEERYPEDRAVGYEVGEFRGLIRVTVPLENR